MNIQFFRYILVGISNTIFGYLIIFSAMYFGFSPIVSNMLGYGILLLISFVLNRIFTFRSKGQPLSEFIKFLVVFAVAFGINLLTLYALINFCNINKIISQVLAGLGYIVISYLMNKLLVFKMPRELIRIDQKEKSSQTGLVS